MAGSDPNVKIVVERNEDQLRLDQFLAQATTMSRRGARRLIDDGRIERNGNTIRISSRPVETGDVISIFDPDVAALPNRERVGSVEIVYEDRWLVIVNKPAGVLSQPSESSSSDDRSIDEKLLVTLAERDGRPPFLRLIHRLDRICSGVLLFAHHRDALSGLAAAWKSRSVIRDYLAVVKGRPALDQPTIVDAPITRDLTHTWRFKVSSEGKPAKTSIQMIGDIGNGLFLVACRLSTGRTHQVRVHLKSLGYPLVADRLYGGNVVSALERPVLHAYSLALPHPVTKERIEVVAPLPSHTVTLLSEELKERIKKPLFDL